MLFIFVYMFSFTFLIDCTKYPLLEQTFACSLISRGCKKNNKKTSYGTILYAFVIKRVYKVLYSMYIKYNTSPLYKIELYIDIIFLFRFHISTAKNYQHDCFFTHRKDPICKNIDNIISSMIAATSVNQIDVVLQQIMYSELKIKTGGYDMWLFYMQ